MTHHAGTGSGAESRIVTQIIEGLPVGVVIAAATGRVVWMNRAAEDFLGAPAAETLGQPVTHVLKDPQVAAVWHTAVAENRQCVGEISALWPRPLELKVTVAACTDPAGAILGRALLVCDVAAERVIKVELSRAVAERLLALTSAPTAAQPAAGLTQRELGILRLVGRGLGNDAIAVAAQISASTVRSHLKSLYRKLNLASRAAAVSFAVRNHLV
jgi:DNA-binding CsgD family transcriptional regulator